MKFELSTFKTVASCSILMLTNFSVSGQTKFSFDDQTLKKFYYQTLFPVEYKQITDNSETRKAYMISIDEQIPISSDELKGSFIVISDKMGFHDKDVTGHFLKYELCEEVMRYYELSESHVLLVENENTKKLYLMYSSLLKSMNEEKEKIQKDASELKMIDGFMQSMGYKTSQIDGVIYVKTKYYRILCNLSTVDVLQKDKEYLKKIDGWFEQREAIRKQIIATIPKFDHYARLYRVQRNRMSKADISSWTTLTKSANLLNKKEVDLTDKLWGLLELQNATENYHKYSSEFIDYLSASTGVLGI
ncbi:hypothetical protein B0A69_00760 [Chryseobacterium shigense]|uniref:Uncharacterized protein n=1 Tax=Chryseobacterium shigense TaxID=297244 RepID=A0A1N7HZN3_9FLAO|nr:hypothetical protein [Chryseobacterium shigense]PQA97897.1 hypothetical protein B0A69_00760 [Chryseobacterium shigense]SIS30293.1 hypothetical protein SAMN05421639_101822 [Chryseobacterium shigense]